MKECKNEHKGVPVDASAIKDFLTIIQQFFDTVCNAVLHFAFDLGVHLIKSTNVATIRFDFDNL